MHQSTHSPISSGVLNDPQQFADAIRNALQLDLGIWPPAAYSVYQAALAAAQGATDETDRRAFGALEDAAGDLATRSHSQGIALGMAIEPFRRELIRIETDPN